MAKKVANATLERLDYDNLFKTLLHRYFWEALKIFLPALYEAADRSENPKFLDKELQKVTFDLEGGANRADLLARIKLKNGSNELILCHLEIRVPRAWASFKRKRLSGMPMLRKEMKCKSMPYPCCEGW